MIFRKLSNVVNIQNLIVVIAILVLPYYLFEGKLFIGGDDTRLFYLYPSNYIRHIAFYSWNSFSSYGLHNPNQYSLPLLFIWSLLESVISSKIILNYLAFSVPLLMAFFSFELFVYEMFGFKDSIIEKAAFLGALMYILSPITLLHQISVFLITVWFLAVLPLMLLLLLKYLKTGSIKFILLTIISAIFFSIAFYSIPWIIGTLIPICISLLIIVLLNIKQIPNYIFKRGLIFITIFLLTQAFWILPFISTILVKSPASFGGNILSGVVADTFRPVVNGTATGNTIYPIMNLPHHKIIFDYNWPVKEVFNSYFRLLFPLNLLFPLLFFASLSFYKKVLSVKLRYYFLSVLGGFAVLLFLFTVNIGPFKDLFISLGRIPGFVIFRNFYDKFAIGFIFYYSLLFTIALYIVFRKFKKVDIIYVVALIVLLVNALPIKQIINAPLWGTKHFSKNINYPDEYFEFIGDIEKNIDESANILSLPFNIASYAIISINENEEAYIGTSPITLLTGIKNISGNLSLSDTRNLTLSKAVKSKDYGMIKRLLDEWNINYIITYNSIPNLVRSSYLFDLEYTKKESELEIDKFTNKKLLTSRHKRFSLYDTGVKKAEMSGNNIIFKKISPVEYRIALSVNEEIQSITLHDSFHYGWKLYNSSNFLNTCDENIVLRNATECKSDEEPANIFVIQDIFKTEVSNVDRNLIDESSNVWSIKTVSSESNNESYQFYTLYFEPQNYFYIGSIITLSTLVIYLYRYFYYERKKN